MVSLATARFVVLSLFILMAGIIWWLPVSGDAKNCQCLTVAFLDVGQGDAVYIRTSDNYEVLVDGGRDGTVLRELAKQQSFFDRQIDLVVATHPDADHIGGLVDVLRRYEIDSIIMTETTNNTPAFEAFSEAVSAEQARLMLADAGQRFLLGASTTLTIFSPRGDEKDWETNNSSVVMKISFGETDILLTGDAYTGIENYLVGAYGADLEAEILKLGHHGSKTSTSELFLDTVQPEYAIVSAGIDNRYNHPHQEVMERVFSRSIATFHTGTDGTIIFESDGKNIKVK